MIAGVADTHGEEGRTVIMSSRKWEYTKQAFLAIVATLLVAVIFMIARERISITDIDAISYIEGAHSLQLHKTYAATSGEAINHWPPGYSLILSIFEEPINGAMTINSFSLGVAVVALWSILRASGWTLIPRLGLVLVMGAGFFRAIATFAKPDIFTYALFLVGVYLYMRPGHARRISFVVWSFLIPVKLIAVVFIPSALVADLIGKKGRGIKLQEWIFPVICWTIGVISIALYNLLTIGTVIPISHGISSVSHIPAALVQFVTSIARDFLASWYGTIREPSYLLVFGVTLLVAIASLTTLRANKTNTRLLIFGLAVLASSALLALVRTFYTDARLLGYGVIVTIASLRVIRRFQGLWLVYGVITVCSFVYGIAVTSQYGINHPAYIALTEEVLEQLPEGSDYKIYTNTDRLFSVLGGVSADLVDESDISAISGDDVLIRVLLPNFDEIMTPIHPLDLSADDWCPIRITDTYEILQRC